MTFVSDPPVESPSILNSSIANGNTYSIIEGRQGLLTCAVPKSKPVANLSWNGLNNRQDIEKTIVTNRLEWIASRQDTNISTCIAKHHCHNYERSISIMIKVLCKYSIGLFCFKEDTGKIFSFNVKVLTL
jgi:hypothetical protein